MFAVLLRRSTFNVVNKVLRWSGPTQTCWTSSLSAASPGGSGSSQTCWASSVTPSERDTGSFKRPRVHGFMKSELFLRTRRLHTSAVRLKKRPKPDPPPRELDLLRYDMKHLWDGPRPALYLGFAGLIPFALPTLFMGVTETYVPELAYAQLAYGASIISFLGGARWGFTLPESSPAKPDWINLANSVVPSLIAWLAVLMSDSVTAAGLTVIVGLGVALHYDLSLLPTYPSWFKALRSVLTVVAFFSLLGTLVIKGMFPEKKMFTEQKE